MIDWLTYAGALTAQCVGVNKTAVCKLVQRDDFTFTLIVRPQETGRHMLTIKFNNEHVPGRHQLILLLLIYLLYYSRKCRTVCIGSDKKYGGTTISRQTKMAVDGWKWRMDWLNYIYLKEVLQNREHWKNDNEEVICGTLIEEDAEEKKKICVFFHWKVDRLICHALIGCLIWVLLSGSCCVQDRQQFWTIQMRALDLRLEIAGSIPAAALSSATLDKLLTHIVQRLWSYNLMALYKSV